MGYRSEVKIATTREGYDALLEIMDLKNESVSVEYPLIGSGVKPGYFEEEGGAVVFGWDAVKWYDGLFREVDDVVEALAEIAAKGHPLRVLPNRRVVGRHRVQHRRRERLARAACRAVGRHRDHPQLRGACHGQHDDR